MKILHIINPFISNDINNKIVSLTCDSIIRAKKQVKYEDLIIENCYTCYEEDLSIMKNYLDFKQLTLLERSILDIKKFNIQRKLPLLFDILNKSNEIEYDYIIYSNIDIHLMENFYNKVYEYIISGIEDLTINRVTIYKENILNTTIDELYPLIQTGDFHPGLDCFVMKKQTFQNIKQYDFCIGFDFFDKYLYYSLHNESNNSIHLLKSNLTFHIGDDRTWKNDEFLDYRIYNKDLFTKYAIENDNIKCIGDYYTKRDDCFYYLKYHYSLCYNNEDKDILSFFYSNGVYTGNFIQFGKIDTKLIFMFLNIGFNGYIIEDEYNLYEEIKEQYPTNKNLKILNTKIDLNIIEKDYCNKFDLIIFNNKNKTFLKDISLQLLFNCKIIYLEYNNKDDMYVIKNYLSTYGFSNIIKINDTNIILSKY